MPLDELIQALQILKKYGNPLYPTRCEEDALIIREIDPNLVLPEDIEELDKMGFFVSEDNGDRFFKSFRYGSA